MTVSVYLGGTKTGGNSEQGSDSSIHCWIKTDSLDMKNGAESHLDNK